MKQKWSYFVLPFLFFFLLFLLAINWSQISWIFDWQIIKRISEEVVLPQKELGEEALDEANRLLIPSLDVEAPLRTPESSDHDVLLAELDKGVVLYPGLAKPGEKGRAVVLGHSAPPGYPDIKFDRVFSHLGDLSEGDRIKVYYNERLFVYIAAGVQTMTIDEFDRYLSEPLEEEYVLIISTCYPPGQDWQRWVSTSYLLTE